MSTIAIIDYGMGNLHSIAKALEHVAPDARVIVTADRRQLAAADRVVFPGVGAITRLHGRTQKIRTGSGGAGCSRVADRCWASASGMQALLDDSEENGGTPCLGLFSGHVRRFPGPT